MTDPTSPTEVPVRPRIKRCWLHIGMHKTGTTSLQSTLAKVRKPAGWRYMKVGGRANMGKSLCAMFASNPNRHSAFAKLGMNGDTIAAEGKKLRENLRTAILNTKQDTIIISAEAMSSAIDKNGLVRMKEFLEPLCGEIKVIGYVRAPLAFKNSWFQQHVKNGSGKFRVSEIKVDYRKRFKKFDDVFGLENVIVRKFDPSSFPHHCIVADFCEQIGIDAPDRSAIVRSNESLSREACGLLYAYRKFGPGYGIGDDVIKENMRIIAPMYKMAGTKFKVLKSLMETDPEYDKKDLRWMEKRMGARFREKVSDDGTEVTSEQDLLTIKGSTCQDYAASFTALHGDAVDAAKIPEGETIDPKRAAEFVEYCRNLCRSKLLMDRARKKRPVSKVRKMFARFFRPIKKLFTRSRVKKTVESAVSG